MARLREHPPRHFREEVLQAEIELRGEQARAFQFEGGRHETRDALVCIAGMGANGRSFARQRPLSGDRLVLMLNTPNATPPGEDPLQFAAGAVEQFIDEEGLENPIIMGSSFGGAVAATVALRRAPKLGGLILISPVLARWQIPLAFPQFVDFIQAPAPIARLMAPLAVSIMGGFALDRDGRDEVVRESRNFTSEELKRRLEVLLRINLVPALAACRSRTLWIHGSRDLLVPWRRARKAAISLGVERFELIKGAGHLPYLSHPSAFNDLVTKFLTRPALRAAG